MPARLLAAIWLSAFLVSVDYTALNVALPTLATEFGRGTSDISWVALAYMFVMVALTLLTGPAIDRLGYRRALTGALAIFALGSLAGALTSAFWLLVAMRAVQGIGASVMFVIGPAVIRTLFAAETQNRAFAIFSTGPTAGLCAGPVIGGQLTAMFGWQSIFLFSLATALLAMALLQAGARGIFAREMQGKGRAAPMPDPLAAGLTFAGTLMLVLALNQGKEWGWTSPSIATLLLMASIAFISVVFMERHAQTRLIDRRILGARDFAISAAVFFPLLVVFGGSVFLAPFYFEWLRKTGADVVGRLLMIQPIATLLVSSLLGFGFSGVNRRVLCLTGICLLAMGVGVFAAAGRDAPLAVPITALFLIGAGAGLYYPTLIQVSMADVPGEVAASAASLQTAVRVLAQLTGVVFFETIFSQLYPSALNVTRATAAEGAALGPMQSAFHAVFWCGAAIAAVALLPAVGLARHSPPSSAENPPEAAGEAG